MIPTTEERIAFWEKVYKGYKEQQRQLMQQLESYPYALNHPLSEDLLRDAEAMQQDVRIIEGKSGPFLAVTSPAAELTIKEEEDADFALVESWDARRRASIYMLLYHQGMRESTAREILRKTK